MRYISARFTRAISMCLSLIIAVFSINVNAQADAPTLNMTYGFVTHHSPIMVAAEMGELFKESGSYIEEIVPRERYNLKDSEGKKIAEVNFIVNKSTSTTALIAMGQLDMALVSVTVAISGVDKGIGLKVLSPLHIGGFGMTFPKGSEINSFDDLRQMVEQSENPVKIGYSGPEGAPRVLFEAALHEAGFKITGNAYNSDADILMVDLKSVDNLIPALVSAQVDAWVGPAPHPEMAEYRGVGHVGIDSLELSPADDDCDDDCCCCETLKSGGWEAFPCCVLISSDKYLAENPAVVEAMISLMTAAGQWINENPSESAAITSGWIGAPAEVIESSSIIFTTNPTEQWLQGVDIYMSKLNDMDKFTGEMKDAELKDVKHLLFDFSLVDNILSAQEG